MPRRRPLDPAEPPATQATRASPPGSDSPAPPAPDESTTTAIAPRQRREAGAPRRTDARRARRADDLDPVGVPDVGPGTSPRPPRRSRPRHAARAHPPPRPGQRSRRDRRTTATTVASSEAGSSSRDGTEAEAPKCTMPLADDVGRDGRPELEVDAPVDDGQPAASICALRASARAQSRSPAPRGGRGPGRRPPGARMLGSRWGG